MMTVRVSIAALGLVFLLPACGQSDNSSNTGNGNNASSGSGDTGSGVSVTSGGSNGGFDSSSNGGFSSSTNGGFDTGTTSTAGTSAGTTGTSGSATQGSTASVGGTGTDTTAATGSAGTTASTVTTSSTGATSASGSTGATSTGATSASGSTGATSTGSTGGMSSSTTGGMMLPPQPKLVTSAPNGYWNTSASYTVVTSGNATITVNDSMTGQSWDGFGGAFNEIGWSVLTTADMQAQAMKLLFSTNRDGAAFGWGRIPIGASDYATSRYTEDDTGTDVAAMSSGANRPATDTSLSKFSLDRDGQKLIPYIKAAQAVNPALRFWASPWTPPVWMKTGYKTDNGSGGTAKKPSYFDGGNMVNNAANLMAYAQYYTKFVQGYKAQNINIELVSPQNEPGYDQNYPSCLWDKATYVAWVGQYLGPAMKALNVKVMLGTLSNAGDNNRTDLDIATAVLQDPTAKTFVSVAGVQWGVLDKVNGGTTFAGLPIWATEHKCGNYPWNPAGYPAYNSSQAPNDQAYGVETWGYIRDAITKGKVNAYDAWNMVLDKSGLGNDTSRDWKQDALLVADSGKVNPTPAYYVFRHFSQFVVPGAKVVATSGGDAVAFKNQDGSIVVVMYNSGAAGNYTVSVGGKLLQFAMPGNGWATVYYAP